MTLPEPTPPPSRWRRFGISVLVGICCFLIYNANRRAITAGDTYPARYLPIAIWQNHTVLLDPIVKIASQGRTDTAFWIVPMPTGHKISLYPVVVPLAVAPLYYPAIRYLEQHGTDAEIDHVARVMEKVSASFLAALSASLVYLLLRRRATEGVALLLTAAYALGTTTWVISSQALWQHGLAEVLVIAALLLVTLPCTTPRALAVGLLCGLIAANRPPDAILSAAIGAYALYWAGRRRAIFLIVASLVPAFLVLAYNLQFGGNLLGGYGVIGKARFFRHDLLTGIAGLLVSPTRGIFLFSPFLLFLVLLWRHRPRDRDERLLTLAMCVAVVLQVFLYAKVDWRSGLSWGPRYLTDVLPFLVWMLVPIVAALRGFARGLFLIATAVSIAIEAIGALYYTPAVDLPIFDQDRGAEYHAMRGAFAWRNMPVTRSLDFGLAPADLLTETRGTFDAIESARGRTTEVMVGEEAVAVGWALVGSATPAQIAISVDGHEGFSTSLFVDRPDVRIALHEPNPSGWKIPIDTSRLTPGPHRLTVFVWGAPNGEGHYLQEIVLTVKPMPNDDLPEAFRKAAARLRDRQQADGYWLTTFTKWPRYDWPRPEMNTFLTALLVDELQPVAAASGLEETLQRARRHLTEQIEPSGLVRYHGRPDGPGIGTIGCAITPDTDDTALAWRLAPAPDRRRLDSALATIDRYRTPEGLYRTWLAPRDEYQCLDPGHDPNPTDIAIQMHLLLLLAQERPAAAHALCDALTPLVDQNRVWVYYRRAPLVPTLRQPDLQRAGCNAQLPSSRMQSTVAGQDVWLKVARMLIDGTPSPDAEQTLHDLARDDFAYIRTSPPLFYHNDLTASVSRYYWSEDFGYVLWLRLYEKWRTGRDGAGSPPS
ncbi:MAG: hypothetical protein JOZ54_21075 [Acidobacteria bacterium]|nr:hypothetical protein [Acidobacteriota bacterium]